MDAGPDPDGGPDAVLTEPARQRLVIIAADVLGRLPADEVPGALRSIAKFTPGKRARLGAAPLSAALDADPDFREKVAHVVAEASPQLADAIRDGTSTAASDPVDTAVVAYLTRPPGWGEVLRAANERWAAERSTTDAGTGETAVLRAEIAELRARARTEPARLREALAAAAAHGSAELAELRAALRTRSAELRAAQRARDDAVNALAAAQRVLGTAASAHDAEQRRLRSRVAELERAAGAVRRGARADRDVDDARLWLLVETVTEAAAGIRRELSLAAPSVRPADFFDSSGSSGPTRRVDDAGAIDGLLALPNVHVIVDGYNVTKSGYGELALADQRTRLVGSMAALAGRSGAEVTIAFDGGTKPPAQPRTPRGVRVLFSAAGEIADDLIRALVSAEPPGRPVVVVTSDQQVAADVLRAGAWAVPSAVLLARLG